MTSFKEKEQLMGMKKNANINQSLDYDKSIVKRKSS